MSDAFYVGAVGLQSQQRALDIIAGNLANLNTPAFKRSQVRFSDVLATRSDPDVPASDLAEERSDMAGVSVDTVMMANETGALQTTGQPLDFAIDGPGFIELMGPDGQTLLWRGGTLKVGEDGMLATASGLPLKAAITVPDDVSGLTIGSDGVVRAKPSDGSAEVELGQVEIVRVDDSAALTRLDGGYFRAAEGARTTEAKPGEDGAGLLVQGAIERSNVDMTTEMVQLMLVQRAYGANAQVVQAADQLMSIANGLRR